MLEHSAPCIRRVDLHTQRLKPRLARIIILPLPLFVQRRNGDFLRDACPAFVYGLEESVRDAFFVPRGKGGAQPPRPMPPLSRAKAAGPFPSAGTYTFFFRVRPSPAGAAAPPQPCFPVRVPQRQNGRGFRFAFVPRPPPNGPAPQTRPPFSCKVFSMAHRRESARTDAAPG